MNIARLLLVSSGLWLASLLVFSQQLDPNLRGVWKLNIEKSDFGGNLVQDVHVTRSLDRRLDQNAIDAVKR